MKRLVSLVLIFVCCLSFVLCGCDGTTVYASTDLMEGVTSESVSVGNALDDTDKVVDFCVSLFKQTYGDNSLVSPMSVLYALAMTANGARGQTLAEMEQTMGLPVDSLNKMLLAYSREIEKNNQLSVANAIWLRDCDDFVVSKDFLQTNANYYGAGAFRAPFDETTVNDINNFVKANTNGLIKKILNDISVDAMMYLVNALAFKADWQTEFEHTATRKDDFTKADGTLLSKNFMHSTESTYVEDDSCTGVVKYYKGNKYAFVGLLPKGEISEFVQSLDGDKLLSLVKNATNKYDVKLSMPVFKAEYDVLLNDALVSMGIQAAFCGSADFSGMQDGQNDLYIGRVLHKTFISVNEKGTEAAAATVVEMECKSVGPREESKTVNLNRPFVYLIWDVENNLPVFIGNYVG